MRMFVTRLQSLFQALPQATEGWIQFRQSNLVVRLTFEDLGVAVTVDGRTGVVQWEPTAGRADLELFLTSALFHDVMMETQSLRQSILNGAIRVKGNVLRALPFTELLQAARPLYQARAAASGP